MACAETRAFSLAVDEDVRAVASDRPTSYSFTVIGRWTIRPYLDLIGTETRLLMMLGAQSMKMFVWVLLIDHLMRILTTSCAWVLPGQSLTSTASCS